jgi:hypothetical protein
MTTKMTTQPARKGKAWTIEEDSKLLESTKNGKSIEDIAREHDRTEGGIWSHLCVLAHRLYRENCPMGTIVTITGLTEREILDYIKRVDFTEGKNEKKDDLLVIKKGVSSVSTPSPPSSPPPPPPPPNAFETKLEIMNLINDIQMKMTRLNILVAMMN